MKQGSSIVIDPVTRIEGHSKITLHLNEDGRVEEARFHVTQFRGFEKLCEGRPFYEMPSLMARICGICPVSHLIASRQGLRSAAGGENSADRRQAAAHFRAGAGPAVARAEPVPSFVPRPAAGHGRRSGDRATFLEWRRRIPSWRSTASGCGSLASGSSSGWAASAFIRRGSCPAV